MLYLAVLAGIIQGLTEFLPISSSGHLVLLHDFYFGIPDTLTFDVVLHVGTLLALLVFFRKDLGSLIRGVFNSLKNWQVSTNYEQRLAWFILAGTIPAALVGYFWADFLEVTFRNSKSVAIMLIVFGVLLYLADIRGRKTERLEQLTWGRSIIIGLAQALALIPGVSRSGITIIAGLGTNLNRLAATKYAFLLSIPIVTGAAIKKVYDLSTVGYSGSIQALLLGFLTAAVVGYFTIRYLLAFVSKHSLKVFAYYRIALGIIILLILT